MFKFLIQFCIAAALLGAVVWFGIPVIADHFPEQYKQLERLCGVPEAGRSPETGAVAESGGIMEPIQQFVQKIAEPVTSLPVFDNTKTAEPPTPTATNSGAVAESPAPPVVEAVPEEEELERYVVVKQNSRNKWGVVVTNSFVYSASMEQMGIMLGGTVVEQVESKIVPDGYVSGCQYVKKGRWQKDAVYLYDRDVVFFDTPLYESNPDDRRLIIRYCELYGQLEDLTGKARIEAIKRNPHYAAYRKAVLELEAFNKESKRLSDAHNAAEGSERGRLFNTLRQRKADEVALTKAYSDIKTQYEKWRNDNLGTGKNFKVPLTPEMRRIRSEMDTMRRAVNEIVPGLAIH